jgi:hypothetical protein
MKTVCQRNLISYWANKENQQRPDGVTDGRQEEQADSSIPPYNFVVWGYKNKFPFCIIS